MKKTNRSFLIPLFLLVYTTAVLADATGSFSRTLQVSGTPDVEISTGSGNIVIRTGSSSSISINARIKANDQWFGGGSLSAADKVKRIESNQPITKSGSFVTNCRISNLELSRNVSISYEVTMLAS